MPDTVHIEFQRVQTWLFSVPRLRAMIGANTMLGEVLRRELPSLARTGGAWSWTPASGDYAHSDADDPLDKHSNSPEDRDDPSLDATAGVLSRDGGHFEALFSSGAKEFADAASALLRARLPGLKFRISVNNDPIEQSEVEISTELPVLTRCAWTGRGLASDIAQQGDDIYEVSADVSRRHSTARRSARNEAGDLASLMMKQTKLRGLSRPETFEQLSEGGYMAVIHADGNGVGYGASRLEAVDKANFFHTARVLIRRAVLYAIDRACEGRDRTPLVLLMLGGDDMLVVSRADCALQFIVDVCAELHRAQANEGNNFTLTLGAGIVFSRPTVPFHRLHEVAERLAESAKRRFRGAQPSQRTSVVDWAVYTTAWVDDFAEVRRRDWVLGSGNSTRILSLRPLSVLGAGLDSLEGLLRASVKLNEAPRSQLRYLLDQLSRGKVLAEIALRELSAKARISLKESGLSSVWTSKKDRVWATSVLDLIEVFEIRRLGRGAGTNSKQAGAE
jgi:hypothetical protein